MRSTPATPKTQSALLKRWRRSRWLSTAHLRAGPSLPVLARKNPVIEDLPCRRPRWTVSSCASTSATWNVAHEVQVLDRFQRSSPIDQLEPVASADELLAGQKAGTGDLCRRQQLKEYIARVTHRTRSHADVGLGASSRGSLASFERPRPARPSRDATSVTPDDVKSLALPVLAHRLILKANAELRGLTPAKVLTQILETEPVPPPNVVSRFGRRVAI